jgi:thioredoxin-like negative regulator of GroEL
MSDDKDTDIGTERFALLGRAGYAEIDTERLERWPKEAHEPAFVAFLCEWCEVCAQAEHALEEFATRIDGRAGLHFVDVGRHHAASERLNVRSVPCFVVFGRERELGRFVGAGEAHTLSEFLDRALKEMPPPEDAPTAADAGGSDASAARPQETEGSGTSP